LRQIRAGSGQSPVTWRRIGTRLNPVGTLLRVVAVGLFAVALVLRRIRAACLAVAGDVAQDPGGLGGCRRGVAGDRGDVVGCRG